MNPSPSTTAYFLYIDTEPILFAVDYLFDTAELTFSSWPSEARSFTNPDKAVRWATKHGWRELCIATALVQETAEGYLTDIPSLKIKSFRPVESTRKCPARVST